MSTYSNSLRVELITQGDQAGTWGTTTNDNFSYIFDRAIAGYQTVSVVAADQAFTYNDGPVSSGALNQAIYAMIELTTTTVTTAFNVYTNPRSKQYVIWNNTSYPATIFNWATITPSITAAGTGVTIAAGDRVLVVSDGTNFYTIKSSGVTGTVPIANGGTGQTTQQAAINALVGTQTANRVLRSDGTNSTLAQVALATDVSGTLAIANGGTGQTTQQAALNALAGSVTSNQFLRGNGTNVTMSAIQSGDLPLASAIAVGAVGLVTDTLHTGAIDGPFTAANRWYGIQLASPLNTGVVNVPWTDTTYSLATSTVEGLVKLGSDTVQSVASNSVTATASRTYAIQLNSSGQAVVNVPWTGTVTGVTATSPVASSGGTAPTISLSTGYGDTQNPYASKTANFVLAAPNGSAGAPTFRALVAADVPTLNQNTTGTAAGLSATLAIGSGGTGTTTAQGAMNTFAGTVTSGQYLRGNGTNVVMATIQAADVPTLNQNTTGTAAGLSTTLAIGSGGTGTTTAQGAMNTFAGAVTAGSYLRGNGTNVVMSTIQAADVPTLNQNTTGSAASASSVSVSLDTTTATAQYVNFTNSPITLSGIKAAGSDLTYTPSTKTLNVAGTVTTTTQATTDSTTKAATTAFVQALMLNQVGGGNRQVFQANGTFTVPQNVTAVRVTVFGGGGGGGGSDSSANPGGLGGTGGSGQALVTGLTPGASVAITVGSGGAGGAGFSPAGVNGNDGSAGTTSSFGASVSATGGAGGQSGGFGGATGANGTFTTTGTILARNNIINVNGAASGSTGGAGGGGGGFTGGGGGGQSFGSPIAGGTSYGQGDSGSNSSGVTGGAGGSPNGGAGATGLYGGGGGGGGGGVIVEW